MDRTINAKIDTELPSVNVDGVYNVSGYRGNNSRQAYQYFKKNDLNEYKSMETASGIEDVEFNSFSVENEDFKNTITNTPLTIKYNYDSEEILEEINDKLILNVGSLIGTQSELYQEEKRVNPIELQNPNRYTYIINVEIPDGYEPKNLENLNIKSSFDVDGELGAHFISNYKLEEDKVTISISEKYPITNMSIEYYDQFKDVINSAFDFSKQKILFVQKQ